MVYKETNDIMKAFFEGRVKNEVKQPKLVELGYGKGIGHSKGTYSQYVKGLGRQMAKGNGIISIGKSVVEKDIFSIPNPTDKFIAGDTPHLLVSYDNIIDSILLKATWKDSDGDMILEQYYEIPRAYSVGSDWWDSYGVLFVGPKDLEEGDYSIEIISRETISKEQTVGDKEDNIKTLRVSLEFSVGNSSE